MELQRYTHSGILSMQSIPWHLTSYQRFKKGGLQTLEAKLGAVRDKLVESLREYEQYVAQMKDFESTYGGNPIDEDVVQAMSAHPHFAQALDARAGAFGFDPDSQASQVRDRAASPVLMH